VTALWLALLGTSLADEPKSWLGRIRYGVGLSFQAGVGAHTADPVRPFAQGEALSFELRSYFTDHVGTHTVLNLGRTAIDATRGRGLLDYATWVAFYVPRDDALSVVIAPGAEIAYTFDDSPFARFAGSWRVGFDWHGPRKLTVGAYLRPYYGWLVVDEDSRGLHLGASVDVSLIWRVGKRWDD
jgi:hypothetical protein